MVATIRVILIISSSYFGICTSIPVDNGVEGEPEIECGSNAITANFNTRNPFEGHVYVKGLFSDLGCRTDGSGQQRSGSIALPFDICGVRRTRSLNPKGIFISVTIIISFHPHFETKVDRAYSIRCFYMEADKTVATELEVSALTTIYHDSSVPMPTCRYEILNGPNGPPIQYANVGQAVYHKWTCDTETVNTFCMRVYGCFVDDGRGDLVQLLDDKGCAQDRFLLNNLEYPTDLMAGKEAHVFKYADRVALYFQCQVLITIKEPNGECPKPECPEPSKGRKRRQAHQAQDYTRSVGVVDVVTEIWAVANNNDQLSSTSNSSDVNSSKARAPAAFHEANLFSHELCLPPLQFSLICVLPVILTTVCIFLFLRIRKAFAK